MAKASNNYLQPNPFKTHRDPQTGSWIVIQTPPADLPKSKNSEDVVSEVRSQKSEVRS